MQPKKRAALAALGIEVYEQKARNASAAALPEAGPAPSAAPVVATPEREAEKAATRTKAGLSLPDSRVIPGEWEPLKAMVRDCRHCKLCETRTQTVFGVGVQTAALMIVGEGPGADEDAQGEPFVGRAGKLLDEMLKSIGHNRAQNTYIANVVKCRPPGNRDPEKDEVEGCRAYLDAQIGLIKPKLIVALGRIAAQRLLGSDEPLSRMRGPIHNYGELATPVFVTYHPAYLLRSPKEKAKSWEDLKKIWQFLQA